MGKLKTLTAFLVGIVLVTICFTLKAILYFHNMVKYI